MRAALLRLYERHGRRLPPAAAVILVVLIAIALADFVWTLMPRPEAGVWRPAPAQPTAAAGRRDASVDLASVQNANLFGEFVLAPTPGQGGDAPPTNLNLKLLGVLASDDNERYSRALIEVQPGEERPFAVGTQVIQGTSLQAILPDRVVLSRGGKLETLRLEKGAGDSGVEPPDRSARGGDASGAASSLTLIREQVLQDPGKAAEYVRVQPANQDGKLHGYRIYPGKDRSIFSQVGLRPGDLVTQVNGVQLDDASKALKMLSELKDVNQLNLVVERGGQAQTINVNLN